jgi:hypothetical protein
MATIKRKPRPPAEPRPASGGAQFAWGGAPLAPPPPVDGAPVAGYRLVRGPSGALVGIRDPEKAP